MDVCVHDEYWIQDGADECPDKTAVCRALLRLVDRVACNGYGICLLLTRYGPHKNLRDMQQQQGGVAAGLFVTQSLINHSCVPNCELLYTGATSEIRTQVPIPVDEQLTVSYGPRLIDLPRVQRQQFLNAYAFTCTCSGCIGELTSVERRLHGDSTTCECDACAVCQQRGSVERLVATLDDIVDDESAAASGGVEQQLRRVSQLVGNDNVRLAELRLRAARATVDTAPTMSQRMFADALAHYARLVAYFPMDYERVLSEVVWTSMRIAYRSNAQLNDTSVRQLREVYALGRQLYGDEHAKQMLDMRFGDIHLYENWQKFCEK